MGVIALTNPYALKSGTLSIAADDFTAAVTQVEFSPSVSQSSVRTINGVVHREQSTSEWTVTVGFVQDLAAPGLMRYLLDNDGQSKAATFVPESGGPSISATIIVAPGTIGGTAGPDLAVGSVTLASSKPTFSDAPGVPVIASVTPAGQSVGEQVLISGTGFASMVSGTIDGAAIASYTVVDDRNLVATIPAGAVGAADIIITNSAGASAAVSYTVV